MNKDKIIELQLSLKDSIDKMIGYLSNEIAELQFDVKRKQQHAEIFHDLAEEEKTRADAAEAEVKRLQAIIDSMNNK